MAHDRSRRTVRLKALTDALHRTDRTVRRYWAEARDVYEARSAARQRPWQAAGVSRATWYRRRAKKKAMQKME
jgi:hypothetical protein